MHIDLTVADWAGVLGTVLAGLVTVVGVVCWFTAMYHRVSEHGKVLHRLERMVNTLYNFHLRRAAAAAIHRGHAVQNSPLRVTRKAAQYYMPILDELQDFYHAEGHRLSERELFAETEERWGDYMVRHVCLPLGVDSGACVAMAMSLMRHEVLPETPDEVSCASEAP